MKADEHHQNLQPAKKREKALTINKFNGKTLTPPVPVYLPWNLSTKQFKELLPDNPEHGEPAFGFPALRNWLTKLVNIMDAQNDKSHPFNNDPYQLRELDIEAADWFKKDKLGFVKLQSSIENRTGWVPGAVFLRGGSVAILFIVQPEGAEGEDEKQVILTVQPRIAASSLAFTEIPAGMLDEEESSFAGKAAKEIKEETGLEIKESELLDMTKLALEGLPSDPLSAAESLEEAMYPSPGACDESITLYLCQKRLKREHLEELEGSATGLVKEGENIKLKLVPLTRLWREGARDAKALAALSLYENLKKIGMLPDMPNQLDQRSEEWTSKKRE
ncbi:ADP-sugar diphosphatase [Alternaria panax]|uniref:ADP-sugar diphosphatase n=1 Tax=Alternaria panax TaxID=48097 RepID=A0AAD4FFY6_9PLEO|nr:ADP-sugar diphosphatase [Alternaria panax]